MDSVAFNPKTKRHEARRSGRLIGTFETGREAMTALLRAGSDGCPVVYHPSIKPAEPDQGDR